MVHVDNWDAFLAEAQQLTRGAPRTARLLVKYRHVDGRLSVKATDNARVRRVPRPPAPPLAVAASPTVTLLPPPRRP